MATILVADDERAVRTLTCMILRVAGYRIVEAANGLEAVSLYRAAPNKYDAVVTDLDMPVMDGFELIKRVRETSPLARIICLSGSSDRDLPEGVPFLKKPFTPAALLEMVKRALTQSSS
jgi:two-component system, cell cycle sensor histidine kinase and response regulator CckA